MCADTPETVDYKDTLNLPKTDFPMRAGLPQREPDWLARWNDDRRLRPSARKGRAATPFTLHDGPPYANGNLHIGHALNKILKDMVVRSQQMMGRDSALHPRLGLPRPAHRVEDRGDNTARRVATRTRSMSSISGRNAAASPKAGSMSSARSSSASASPARGTIPT